MNKTNNSIKVGDKVSVEGSLKVGEVVATYPEMGDDDDVDFWVWVNWGPNPAFFTGQEVTSHRSGTLLIQRPTGAEVIS